MKIMPISTNAHKNRPVFSADLTNTQESEVKRFAQKLENQQLTELKTDALIIQNQNKEIMKQNRYVLKTLLYLAESLRYSAIDYDGRNAAREAKKKAVEGLDLKS